MKPFLIAAALALAAPAVAVGQQQDSSSEHSAGSHAGSGASAQMREHMMQGSKQSMRMKMSGDVDKDFATMMRHHHQTGIRMAQEEIKNGKDPQMKQMAQKILESQQQESKQFDEWLQARGDKGSASGASSDSTK